MCGSCSSSSRDLEVRIARRVLLRDAQVALCSVVDVEDILEKAGTYAYDPTPFLDGLRDNAKDVLARGLEHGGFPAGSATTSIVEDEATRGIIAAAERRGADCIVIGSHGRRGLRRLFLGSVAEHVVRHSPIPVLVVRTNVTPAP